MPKINLFVNHYQCGDPIRQKELDFCYNHNLKSLYFNKVINFDGRPTYADFFNATIQYPEDINILANTDIYFNETILLVRSMDKNDAYALTRWENNEGKIVSFREMNEYNSYAKPDWSQDVCVIYGEAKNARIINELYKSMDSKTSNDSVNYRLYDLGGFCLGQRGCDNRIAHILQETGYEVSNPSNSIKCIHLHKETERNYSIKEAVRKPYKFVPVSGDLIKRKPI